MGGQLHVRVGCVIVDIMDGRSVYALLTHCAVQCVRLWYCILAR